MPLPELQPKDVHKGAAEYFVDAIKEIFELEYVVMALDVGYDAFIESDELVGSVDGEEIGIFVLERLLLVDFDVGKLIFWNFLYRV